MYKMVNDLTPEYLSSICPFFVGQVSNYPLRDRSNLTLPFVRTDKSKKSFLYSAVSLWNSVPQSLRDSESITEFKNYLLRDIFCKQIVLFR